MNDPIPSESAILQQISMNCQLISGGGVAASLRPLLFGAVELLATRVTSLLEPECTENKQRAISILLPATVKIIVFINYLYFNLNIITYK